MDGATGGENLWVTAGEGSVEQLRRFEGIVGDLNAADDNGWVTTSPATHRKASRPRLRECTRAV